MNHTFGYVLCCQSPALFLLAIALVIRFFVRRGKAKFRAVLSLVAGLVCVALGVVLYYQGMLREYFAVRNFWHIRTPGWIGLALVALLLLYLGIQSFLRASARRAEEKEAIRAENQRQLAMEQARADAYEAGRADVMSSFVSAAAQEAHAREEQDAPAPDAPAPDAPAPDAPAEEQPGPTPQPGEKKYAPPPICAGVFFCARSRVKCRKQGKFPPPPAPPARRRARGKRAPTEKGRPHVWAPCGRYALTH